MNLYEIITLLFHSADSTRSTFKRLFNDVIDTANNDVASKRQRERSLESKDDQRAFSVNVVALYTSTSLESVIVRFRQKIRRFERLASRVSSASQSLFQKDDDDDDFDLFFARSYIDLYDHDFDFDFDDETEIISSSQQATKRSTQRQRSNNIRESTRKIKSNDRVRVRVRKSKSRNTRDDINLNFDYFSARKFDFISISHVLFKLRVDENVCSFCKVYRYFEKRDKNLNKQY